MLFFPKYINNTPLTSPHSAKENSVPDSPTVDNAFSPISPVLDKFKDCDEDDKQFGKKNEPSVFVEMKYKEIENLNGFLEALNTLIKSTYFDFFMDQYGDESIYTDDYNEADNIKNSLENLESSLLDLLVLPLVKVSNNNNTNTKNKSEMSNATKEFSHSNDLSEDNDMDQLSENVKYMGLTTPSRDTDTDVEIDYDNEEEEEEQQEVNDTEKSKPKTKEEMKNDLSCNALSILTVFFQYGKYFLLFFYFFFFFFFFSFSLLIN